MPTPEDIVLMASYNASMNIKLYAAAARLPQDVLAADKGAFFGSILGTLNHIVAGDTIWLRRFMHHPSDFASLKAMSGIPVPAGLAHVHSEHLDSLLELRLRLDAIIEALAAELSDGDLAQALSYRNSRGDFRKRFVDIGVTDLLEWIPDLRPI